MADETTPENSGTTEEQDDHRLAGAEPSEQQGPTDEQGDGLAVQTVDEADHEQAQDQQQGEMDLEAEMDELQEMLAALEAENVAVLGCVAVTKETFEDPDGDETAGFQWRVVNDSLNGYEDVNDVVSTLAEFNQALDRIGVQMERPQGPGGLGELLGLE